MFFFPRTSHKRRGFTLIEVLLTVSLFAMSSLAIYQVFSSGLKLWARFKQFSVEEDIMIFFDKISEDLRGSFYYTGIKFNGTQSKIAVPTFIVDRPDDRSIHAGEELMTQIGAVQYYFDFEEHAIHRAQANYAQALNDRFPNDKVLARSISGIKFVYYMPGSKGVEPYANVNETIPSAVYVEVKYSGGKSENSMGRLISVPTGI